MQDEQGRDRRPRTVCLITHQIAGRSGGAERVLVETANAIAARGHRVEVLTHERSDRPPFFPLDFGVTSTNIRRPDAIRNRLRRRFDSWREEKHRSMPQDASYYRFPMGRLSWLSKNGAFWRRLERFIDIHRPDVAIAFLPPAIVALGMIRPQYDLRRIASLHNVPERDLCDPARWDPNPLDRHRRMLALQRHDAITVLQPEFRDWFDADLQSKMTIVPNIVRQHSTAQIERYPREPTVLSVGRLASVKRHGLLIDAWARLAEEFPGWTLKIFGKGPLEQQLKAQIREFGLSGKVRLMGHTLDIESEYLKTSLVAHPAEHEGWGLAASEALAAGVPVIGFASCPGINHLVRHEENGLLVPAGDESPSALAEALAALMRDETRRKKFARNAPASVREYAPDRVYDLWEDMLYEPGSSSS